MSRRPTRDALRPALLSLLVPGAGQLANGHRWRALVFGGGSLALFAAQLARLWSEVQRRVPQDPVAVLDPALPFRIATEVRQANAAFFAWTAAALVGLWLGSVADAWLARREAAPPVRPRDPR